MTSTIVASLDELDTVVDALFNTCGETKIVLIEGDLGSGKTTLVKKMAQYLGIKQEVSSPTFSLQNIYDNRLCHYDIYNIGANGFIQRGFIEMFEEYTHHIIEWADESLRRYFDAIGLQYVFVQIKSSLEQRVYRIEC